MDFPIKNGGSFHSKLLNYQRVSPIFGQECAFPATSMTSVSRKNRFSWFILRPDLGVGFEACFLRNCPYKCPENPEADLFVLVQGWPLPQLWVTHNGSLKNFEQQKIKPQKENQIDLLHPDGVSAIVAFSIASPCFFLTPQVRWTFPKLDLPAVPGLSIWEP